MTYQPNIPTGLVQLDEDYQNIQDNFAQLNTQFNVDHVPLTSTSGTPPNGYHTRVHLVPANTPGTTNNYGQLYSKVVNDGYATDTLLFWKTGPAMGSGLPLQLTSNVLPSATNDGYTFLPGGLILQWGFNASPGGFVDVTLPIPFKNNFFAATAVYKIMNSNTIPIQCTSTQAAGVKTTLRFDGNPVIPFNFYWMAIGN